MKISDSQSQMVNKFYVKRISDTKGRLNHEIEQFCSIDRNGHKGNQHLVDFLKNEALVEDEKGNYITYLVIYDDKIAMYFTLRCSQIYNRLLEFQELNEKINIISEDLEMYHGILSHDPSYEECWMHEDYRSLTEEEIQKKINDLNSLLRKYKNKRDECEPNKNIGNLSKHRAEISWPAIEISYFCFNDCFRKEWEGLQKKYHCEQHTLGTIVFWKLVLEKIQEVRKVIGCRYLVCFAADDTEEQSLVTHYREFLGFEYIDSEYGYIEDCVNRNLPPLFQDLESIKTRSDQFFENFNPDSLDDQFIGLLETEL